MSIEIKTVKNSRFTMEYLTFGEGAETLVIIPGLSVQSVMGLGDLVADAYKSMTERFTIYMFDRIKELPEGYNVFDMAEDTAEAIKELGLSDIALFGASQGGMISMLIASEHPELVKNLVLGSTSACVEDDRYETVDKWVNLAKNGDAEALYLSFGEALYTADVYEQSKELLIGAAKTVTKDELDRFIVLASCMKGFNIKDRLSKITCPVLLIGSEDDNVLGGEATRTIENGLINSSNLVTHMYDGYGHAAYDMAPDYKERMLNFLK